MIWPIWSAFPMEWLWVSFFSPSYNADVTYLHLLIGGQTIKWCCCFCKNAVLRSTCMNKIDSKTTGRRWKQNNTSHKKQFVKFKMALARFISKLRQQFVNKAVTKRAKRRLRGHETQSQKGEEIIPWFIMCLKFLPQFLCMRSSPLLENFSHSFCVWHHHPWIVCVR